MVLAAPVKGWTSDEILRKEKQDHESYELIDGELVRRCVSAESVETGTEIGGHVWTFVRAGQLGRCFGADLHVAIFPDGSHRKPDFAFVKKGRLGPGRHPVLTIAPDLVVEAASPGDSQSEVRAKADLWLSAGVTLVWVAQPETREITVYRRGERPRLLIAEDTIDGSDVLPGFTALVGSLFPDFEE